MGVYVKRPAKERVGERPTTPKPQSRSALIGVAGCATAVSIVPATPALGRPTSPPQAGHMVSTADTIVVGRVPRVSSPYGQPQVATAYTTFQQSMTISISAVFKGLAALPQLIQVNVDSYHAAEEGSFGMFFLNRNPDGTYKNADVDNWKLSTKQSNPARPKLATDPQAAVAQEMLAILSTPLAQLDDPATGAKHMGGTDVSPYGFHLTAAWALHDMPAGYVVAPLWQLAASPDHAIRLWAVGSLASHHDDSALPSTVPDMMDPREESLMASRQLVWNIDAADLPASVAPALTHLLAAKDPTIRGTAAHALGRMKVPSSVAPLIGAIEAETDVEAMRGEMEGLCSARDMITPPCDKVGWYGHHVENPPLWRKWARAQLEASATQPH